MKFILSIVKPLHNYFIIMANKEWKNIISLIERDYFESPDPMTSTDILVPREIKTKKIFMEHYSEYENVYKNFFLEIYHNNLSYLKENYKKIEDHKMKMMSFCIAVSYSDNIKLIKFLMEQFDIEPIYYHNAKCTWHH